MTARRTRVAWFTPRDRVTSDDGFEAALLVAELAADHDIDVYDGVNAHDFVWLHARQPYDLAVYDLADTPAHAFIWAYPCHFPGLLRLPGEWLRASRPAVAFRAHREAGRHPAAASCDDALEPLVLASRMVVVAGEGLAEALRERYPGARVRSAPVGVRPVEAVIGNGGPPRVGVTARSRVAAIERAVQRTCDMGTPLQFAVHATAETAARLSDIVVAVSWPPTPGVPLDALVGMSAGRPVVILETESTAVLPCLDPQTWLPRDQNGLAPVAVSVDPRDESHSLLLALARLGSDAGLRTALGAAAQAWWKGHATIARTADVWRPLLAEAAAANPAGHPAGAGAPDGTERARALLADIGASVDFLEP